MQSDITDKKIFLPCLFLPILTFLLDQITKVLAEKHISAPIKIFEGFNLVLVYNTGAAWGMFSDKGVFLLIISFVALLLIFLFHRKITEGWAERYYGLSLVCGGILGNSADRIWRGKVVDFLDFYLGHRHWPAFNVADSAICIGVGIFIISNLFRAQSETRKEMK